MGRTGIAILFAFLIITGLSGGVRDNPVVSAAGVRAAIIAGAPVYFDNCIIEGDLNLNGLNVSDEVHFNNTIFRGSVNFESMIFNGNANFEGAKFKNDAWFSKTLFKGISYFRDADFGGSADFAGTSFFGTSNHPNVFFNRTFLSITLGAPNGDVDFGGTYFRGESNFKDAKFYGITNFEEAVFSDSADFRDAIFNNDSCFGLAEFNGYASFDEAVFKSYADFGGSKFNYYANFMKADFGADVRFEEVVFNGTAYFQRSSFRGIAEFGESAFIQEAFFMGSRFNITDFSYVQFNKEAHFEDAQFLGATSFYNARFKEDVLFENADFVGELSLCKARYNKLFIRWYNITGGLVYDDAAYMSLMKNFKDLGYYEDYDSCYFQYRKAHRDQPWPAVGSLEQFIRKKIIDYPLEWFYGYGTKPFNAALFSLGIILVFALFWWRVGLGGPKDKTRESLEDRTDESLKDGEEWLDGDATDILGFSATVFLSGTRLFIDPPPLPRIEGRSRSLLKKAFILERVLGALFSVLFFIAISGTIARAS